MDPRNDKQNVQKSLEELGNMVRDLKADLYDNDLKTQLAQVRSDISKKEERHRSDNLRSLQLAELDKAEQKESLEVAKKLDKAVGLLKQALSDQRALHDQMIEKERALSNEALRKAREENDAKSKDKQGKIEVKIKQEKEKLDALEAEFLKLKYLVESLIKQQEVNPKMNDEVYPIVNHEDPFHYGMLYMSRPAFSHYVSRAVDETLRPDVIMAFKVHIVKKLYSDLMKYDGRDVLHEFRFAKPCQTTVEWALMEECLRGTGYILDAEVYYLNPADESVPPAGLVKIEGPELVKQIEEAHAKKGTRICHLYLVSTHDPEEYEGQYDMQSGLSWESADDAEEGDTVHVMKKRGVEEGDTL